MCAFFVAFVERFQSGTGDDEGDMCSVLSGDVEEDVAKVKAEIGRVPNDRLFIPQALFKRFSRVM